MINLISGLQGVGKTTLGDKIGAIDGFHHIDSDRVTMEAESDTDGYIEMLMNILPSDIKPRNYQELIERGARGEYANYVSVGLFNKALQEALENKSRGIKTVMSGGFLTREGREYITQDLKNRGIQAGIIHLQGNIDDLIGVARERTHNSISSERQYASPEDVMHSSEKEELPLHSEGWDRVVKLNRDEVRKDVWEIPELQFLFQN